MAERTSIPHDADVAGSPPQTPASQVDLARALGTTQSVVVPDLKPPAATPLRRAVTWRSVILGLILVAFTAAYTPYNDYVLRNTPFIGNHFPIGIVSIMALLVLAINPLLRLLRATPLRTGELIVIMAMLLTAAAVPSSGLMRYLEPMLMGQIHHVTRYPWVRPLVELLPTWLLPSRDPSSALVTTYYDGLPPHGTGAIPVTAFLIPWAMGFVLMAAILGGALFLAAMFRKQWVVHERLSYPLATIPLELLDDPEKGRYFNKLLRNRLLWAGAAVPLSIYFLNGMADIFPGVPSIRLGFDFTAAFTNHPWTELPRFIQANRLFLSVVGICFFVPTEVALSLWLFLLLNGLARVLLNPMGYDVGAMEPVRGIGVYLAYFVAIVYLARRHLWGIVMAAWHGTSREESEFASYRTMLVGWVLCTSVAWLWLIAVGIHPATAALVLALGTVLITLMARVVAETGLFFLGAMWVPDRFIAALLGPKVVSMGSYYLSAVVTRVFYGDLRETLMPYATNSLRMGSSSDVPSPQRPRMLMAMAAALLVAIVVSGAAHHFLSYDMGRVGIGDDYATNVVPVSAMTDAYAFGHGGANDNRGNAWFHVGVGGAMVAVLMVGRVMFVAWPFHPIGLLLMNAWPLQVFWFSIFIGWGIKSLLLHYGGALVFRRARPFFIGLIIGEMLAAGGWMVVGLISGGQVQYRLFPG